MPQRPSANSADSASMEPEPHRPADIYAPNPFPLDPTQPGGKSVRNPFFHSSVPLTAAESSTSSGQDRLDKRPSVNSEQDHILSSTPPTATTSNVKSQFKKLGAGLKGVFGNKGSTSTSSAASSVLSPSSNRTVPGTLGKDEDNIMEKRRKLYAPIASASSITPNKNGSYQPPLESPTGSRFPASTSPPGPSSLSSRGRSNLYFDNELDEQSNPFLPPTSKRPSSNVPAAMKHEQSRPACFNSRQRQSSYPEGATASSVSLASAPQPRRGGAQSDTEDSVISSASTSRLHRQQQSNHPPSYPKRWSTPATGAYRPSPLANQSSYDDDAMRYPDGDEADDDQQPMNDRIARAREWVARKNQQHRLSAPPQSSSAASLPGAFPETGAITTSGEVRGERSKWETSNHSGRTNLNRQPRPMSHIYSLEDVEPLQPPRSTYVNMGRGYDAQDRMFAAANHFNYVGGGSEGGMMGYWSEVPLGSDRYYIPPHRYARGTSPGLGAGREYPVGYYDEDDAYAEYGDRYPPGVMGRGSRGSFEMEYVDTMQDSRSIAGSEKPTACKSGGIQLAADRTKKPATTMEDAASHAESYNSQEADEIAGEDDGLTTGEQKQPTHPPNKRRLILRLISLFASLATIGFASAAYPVSGMPTPFSSVYGVVIHFLVAIVSTIVSFAFVFNYFSRRLRRRPKMKRYVLLALDILLTLFWFADVFICISRFPCAIGGNKGWCDMYNTSVFLGVVAMASFLVAFGWDIWGAFDHPKKYDPNNDPAMAGGYYDPTTGQWIPGGYPYDPAAAEGGYGYGPGAYPAGPPGPPGRGQGRGKGRGGKGKKDKVPFEFR